MLHKKLYIFFLLLAAVLAGSCSNTRHLPAGSNLFIGSTVHIKDDNATRKERKVLINDLATAVRPRPNSTTLGARLKLRLYTAAGDTKKKKGIRQWIRNKVGEPPVLQSSVDLETNNAILTNMLQNRGFFYASARSSFTTDKKRRSVARFEVTTGPQYHINKAILVKDSFETRISADIDTDFNQTLLTAGAPYNLDLIKAERSRIDRNLKDKGYYFFKPGYILVQADTSVGDHKTDLYVRLKVDSMPEAALSINYINNIYVYPNYRPRGNSKDTDINNAYLYKGYNIVDIKHTYKPDVFARTIEFEKGDKYILTDHNVTLGRLVNMGTFKFVKNRFDLVADSLLDVYYYLTPFPKKSIQFEIGLLTQNDNRVGSNASISWKNRNAFKGAEQLQFKINGGVEKQYSGQSQQPDIYNFGAEMNLSFPRFVVPFVNVYSASQYVPRSLIKLGYNYESESGILRINSYKASYGYNWKEGVHKEHQLYPISFTYVKTDTLGHPETLNLLYGSLLFNGIILGSTYEFTYNSQSGQQRTSSFYFDGLVDVAGNVLGNVEKADYKTNPRILFGSSYAQYVKLQPDFRYYLKLNGAATLANRLLVGIGIPYGNSQNLPNIKQFWAGGNSDLRGFPSRLVGPGTFNEKSVYASSAYIQTLGDMKIEFNTEIRQNLYKFLNMAFFFDAGNIWLYNDNPAFPGGTLTSRFYQELAADIGVGLRFDFKILLLRFDLGMPVRKPWLAEGDRWVFNQVNFGDRSWRRDNLVFNIGIGYPF